MSEFWKFINSIDTSEKWVYEYEDKIPQARELLLNELPAAREWIQWDRNENDPRPLILDLLFGLAWRAFEDQSPKPMQYQPKNITMHFSEQEFEDILFQHPPRGYITFLWDIYDEEGFARPESNDRIVTFLREVLHHGENGYGGITGAALGFIRGKKLELYFFPKNWTTVIEYVHHEIKKMTAVEKARKELPHELKVFVDLVGWEAVDTELQKLCNKP